MIHSLSDNTKRVLAVTGIAIGGYYGARFVKWILMKMGCIGRVDKTAQKALNISHEVNDIIKPFVDRKVFEWPLSIDHPSWVFDIFRFARSIPQNWTRLEIDEFEIIQKSLSKLTLPYVKELVEAKKWTQANEIITNLIVADTSLDEDLIKLLNLDANAPPSFYHEVLEHIRDDELQVKEAKKALTKAFETRDSALAIVVIPFVPYDDLKDVQSEIYGLLGEINDPKIQRILKKLNYV
jgi:hypothetical protein